MTRDGSLTMLAAAIVYLALCLAAAFGPVAQ